MPAHRLITTRLVDRCSCRIYMLLTSINQRMLINLMRFAMTLRHINFCRIGLFKYSYRCYLKRVIELSRFVKEYKFALDQSGDRYLVVL